MKCFLFLIILSNNWLMIMLIFLVMWWLFMLILFCVLMFNDSLLWNVNKVNIWFKKFIFVLICDGDWLLDIEIFSCVLVVFCCFW